MTPNKMRDAKARKITEAAQGLGWEALVEIEGFSFTALLSAEGATGQIVDGKLSKALELIDDFGGPELYPATEEYDVPLGVLDEQDQSCEGCEYYHRADGSSNCRLPLKDKCIRETKGSNDLVSLGIHDAGKDLDEFVAGEKEIEANDEDYEDSADAMCERCTEGVDECGIHEDSEFGDGRYTSPKEQRQGEQISDTPQNEYEHQHGGPALAQEVPVETEGYVMTASRIIAEGGFVIVVRPQPKDQAEGFKVQRFASLNLSHAAALRDKYGYSIGIAAQ